MPTKCLALFSACIRRLSFREQGSGLQPFSASSIAMAAECGVRAKWKEGQRFILLYRSDYLRLQNNPKGAARAKSQIDSNTGFSRHCDLARGSFSDGSP